MVYVSSTAGPWGILSAFSMMNRQCVQCTRCTSECTSQILGPLLISFALFARQVDSPACLLPELPGFLVRMLQGDILDRIFRMFLLVCTSACNR